MSSVELQRKIVPDVEQYIFTLENFVESIWLMACSSQWLSLIEIYCVLNIPTDNSWCSSHLVP